MNCSQLSSGVAIVIPVFNRRETTLLCIRHLAKLETLSWAHVFVVDDASTDGTAEALAAEFPQVTVVAGDGDLWWSGGINVGTEAALAQGAEHVFWLNDDCYPRSGTLEKLVAISREQQAITCPVVHLIETGILAFGGRRKTRSWVSLVVPKEGVLESCDTFSGNCVCIPKAVFDKVGMIDKANIPHAGDIDFGLRASAAGFKILAVGGVFCDGTDPPVKNRRSWLFGDVAIRDVWRMNFHTKSGALAKWAWCQRWRHWGVPGVLDCASVFLRLLRATLLRMLVPQWVLRRWFGGLSHTHRVHTQYNEWAKNGSGAMKTTGADFGQAAIGLDAQNSPIESD